MRALAVLAVSGVWGAALAAPRPAPAPATLTVTGHAQVSQAPDRVYLDIGVTTQAPGSQAAVSRNARSVTAALAALRRAAGPGAQLTTTQYSLTPDYRYKTGAAPEITGYTATNVVRVRLDDLARIGQVIDAATGAGANRLEDIRFTLRDESAARAGALREAALEARQDARDLAAALDLRIVRVLSVTEQAPAAVRPLVYPQAVRMAAARVPTPIESGGVRVAADVTLTVEVAPAPR